MPETARWLGGFIRWLLKGCRTSLQDEIGGNLDATWGGTYDTENYVIGLGTIVIILGIVFRLVF
ncbi:hypothetical protein CLV93_112100 [Prolixibacter denitrificans]|uniref:Uncharacterized protein n=1 Tax=Prolixibacter denitrificans TaxID=1541063 RepID=A0A2P8C7N0_9BACT|nr:hypothetical protein CLV93_112100 [Prolixibacter denitrificans]GET22365.1 hypothetical protein JCM18694_26110 [Prolixibacter denitrificans]